MTPLVIDASAIVEYLLKTSRAPRVAELIEVSDVWLSAPPLCDVEIVAALRRAILARRLNVDRALEAIMDYQDLPITRPSHLAVLKRMIELRANFSAYDATYVALAETLGAELVTADRPLAQAARSHTSLLVHLVD